MGEIIMMLQLRLEELQVSWACSAQNASLLPEKYKKAKGSNLHAKANQYFPTENK